MAERQPVSLLRSMLPPSLPADLRPRPWKKLSPSRRAIPAAVTALRIAPWTRPVPRGGALASRAEAASAPRPRVFACRSACLDRGLPYRPASPALPLSGWRQRESAGRSQCRDHLHATSPEDRRTTCLRRTVPRREARSIRPPTRAIATALPEYRVRRRTRFAGPPQQIQAGTTSSHLLHRFDPEHGEPRGQNNRDAADERQPCVGQFAIGSKNKAQRRFVLALVPQHMEFRGDFLEIEGYTVRLMRLGCGFDQTRPTGEQANQGNFRRVREPVELNLAQRGVGQIVIGKLRGCMPHHRSGTSMGILHIEYRVVFRLFCNFREVKI